MPLVGLTGGVASGKSTVAKLFARCGAALIDADVLARIVVNRGKPAWREIVHTFGRRVLRPDDTLDRSELARTVFRNRRCLKQLNAIVHPRVAREQARLAREIFRRRPTAVVVYDAPVLIEAGAHTRMDRLIVVTADRRTQIARLQRRNHLSRAEALRRVQSQLPLAKKRRMANYVIDGTLARRTLAARVKQIYRELKTMGTRRNKER